MKSYIDREPSNQYSSTNAWNVNLNNGNVNNNTKTNTYQVRVVSGFCDRPESAEMRDFLDFASSFVDAYKKCLSNKRSNPNASFYALRGLTSTVSLAEDVWTGRYEISPGIIFVVLRPVPREVCAATFRDRIVHTWVMAAFEPILEALFPDAITANRKGRGTLGAITLLDERVRVMSENYTRDDLWIFTTDYQGFFMGLDKRVVNAEAMRLIDKHYTGRWKETVKRLFTMITLNRPQDSARRRSPDELWKLIPKNKSLYYCDKWHGLAIGNLPSQWSACMVTNLALRIFERHGIGANEIVSYMDDTAIIIRDKAAFLREISDIERELRSELSITLHPRKRNLQHYMKGWKIVGGKGRMGRLYASDRSIRRFRAKMHYLTHNTHDVQAVVDSFNSYCGLLSKFRTRKVREQIGREILDEYGDELFIVDGWKKAVIKKKYNVRSAAAMRIRLARSVNRRRLMAA